MSSEEPMMKPSSSANISELRNNPRGRAPPVNQREHRMCFNSIHPKCAAYFICIAALHEITFGTILVLANGIDQNWWKSAQWLVILTCRLLQYPSCILALFGVRNDNPALIVPFMLSQVSLGSYADLHTYIQLFSRCATSSSSSSSSSPNSLIPDSINSPIFFIVIPILIYSILLIFFIYNMYIIVRSITMTRSISIPISASLEAGGGFSMGPDDLLL